MMTKAALDYGQSYETAVRDLYGDVPFRQRQYEALVDGQWVDGVADNVVQIGGMITRHWRSQKEISRFTGSLMKIAVIWSMLWRIRFIRTSLELKKKKVRLRESLLQYIKVYSASMHIHH